MLILGLDFETTSLDVEKCEVIEVGAVLWETNTAKPVKMLSELVKIDGEVSAETETITGITAADLDEHGISQLEACGRLNDLVDESLFVMAHNGTAFDKPVFEAWEQRLAPVPERSILWLDTAVDIVYPTHIKTRNLRHLAAEHGFLNPFAHRAIFDVLTMLRVASQYDIHAIIARAAEPTMCVEAIVSFERRDLAKDRGYRWYGPRKMWWKSFKESDLVVEREACGFPIRLLAGKPEASNA